MAEKIAFDLVSPERLLLSEEADMVTVPGSEGYFGVLAGHMPVISTLRPGIITVDGGTLADGRFFVVGGFAEVNPQKITILAEEAISMADVDVPALEKRIRDAEEDLGLSKTEADRSRTADSLEHLRRLRDSL